MTLDVEYFPGAFFTGFTFYLADRNPLHFIGRGADEPENLRTRYVIVHYYARERLPIYGRCRERKVVKVLELTAYTAFDCGGEPAVDSKLQ